MEYHFIGETSGKGGHDPRLSAVCTVVLSGLPQESQEAGQLGLDGFAWEFRHILTDSESETIRDGEANRETGILTSVRDALEGKALGPIYGTA